MSKIARNPVPVPNGVSVEINGQEIKVKGPKGELTNTLHSEVSAVLEDAEGGKQVVVSPKSQSREARALWGTWRSHVKNMVTGVSEGFEKVLELQGVGYRANLQGQNLVLQLGFSHDVHFPVPKGVQIQVDKQTRIMINGIDKRLVGQVAANIKAYRPPEPYKGKGIRYEGEFIMRKEGKKK